MKSFTKPVKVLVLHSKPAPKFRLKHSKDFKQGGFFTQNKNMNVEVVMSTDVVAPKIQNHFHIRIDNTQMKQEITGVRLSFVRTVRAGIGGEQSILNV